ncbi:MAG TPA: hypothetical protein PKD54_15520, partial [Pirellulaceae bacterium]|nr:hypothetical protein [Pirellulaceae bacterium]
MNGYFFSVRFSDVMAPCELGPLYQQRDAITFNVHNAEVVMMVIHSRCQTQVINKFESFQLAARLAGCLAMVGVILFLFPKSGQADDRYWN